MNIRSIKNRADELLVYCKPQFVRVLTIMMLISLIPSLFTGSGTLASIISLVISFLFLPFSHGYVVSSLKVVLNNYSSLKDEDAWVGFSRYKDLFSTYFIVGLITFGILFVLIFIMIFVFAMIFGSIFASLSYVSTDSLAQLFLAYPIVLFALLLMFMIIGIVAYVLSIYFFAAPFLLEQYHLKDMAAVKESIQFINGHIFDLFKLDLSYIGWFILIGVIEVVLTSLLDFIPVIGTLIASIVSGFVGIYTFMPQYRLTRAIFFEEIAYRRYGAQYDQSQQYQEEPMDQYMNDSDQDIQGE